MDKEAFVTNLQMNLKGKVSEEKLQELTAYYSDYIDSQIDNGRNEEELIAELGEPDLLVKTIAERESRDKSGFYFKKGRTGRNWESGRLISEGNNWISGRLLLVVFYLIIFVIYKVAGPMLTPYGKYLFATILPASALLAVLIIRFRR